LPSTKKVVRQDVLSRNFKKWLSKANLLVDKFGVDRTLYSLRHTYASRRRKEGMSYEDLALNMGTSVVLLEKVYSQFKQIQAPARFTGHAYRDIKAKLKLND
jgi:integrase